MVRRATTVEGKDSILYNGKMSKAYSIQNAAFAEIYGFHAGFELDFPLGFYLSSRYNVQIGKEEMNSGATRLNWKLKTTPLQRIEVERLHRLLKSQQMKNYLLTAERLKNG